MSCGEQDAQEWARPVRQAGRGNGPAATPAPRPGPTRRLRLALPTGSTVLGGKAPELDQPGLLARKLKAERRESFAKVGDEPLRVPLVLEPRDVVVGVAHDDHITARVPAPPLVGPEVKDVVQVDVREQRRCRCPLRCPVPRL